MSTTIKKQIEQFLYPHLEYFTDMVYKGKEDTVFRGIRVLDDKEKFTQGALVNAACILYAYYVRNNDPRSDEVLERLHYFIRIAASTECKTWGKMGILRGFNILYENKLFDRIKKDHIELVKEKTDYEDFFNKETLETRGKATNYIHVAMACAGYREKFGWEKDGYADKIKNKLIDVILENSDFGWMDDEIPYGRFDRYSLILTSEIFDTSVDTDLEIPEYVLTNLKEAANIALFISNCRGDGILYGRSVPCHGDLTGAEILASALAADLVGIESIPSALAYIHKVINKLTTVWYEDVSKSFNMWWGGRSTNHYRGIGRILEVNLDLAIHLSTLLRNIERAGLAEKIICVDEIPCPNKWQVLDVPFSSNSSNEKKVIFARRRDMLLTIPFVGLGKNWGLRSSYYPFPVIPEVIEASPIAKLPFFIPEYITNDGSKYRPCQHFSSVAVNTLDDGLDIKACGYLASANNDDPIRSDHKFVINYTLSAAKICVTFTSDISASEIEMITASSNEKTIINVFGFEKSTCISTEDDPDFDGIHGKITYAQKHVTSINKVVGYSINFDNCF